MLGGRHSILETNISQTVGSASSSVASGVLFTIPALYIWGMSPGLSQLTLLAMIPLRRYLTKREHGKLPYPEGGGRQAANVFWGIGGGMAFKLLTDGFRLVAGSAFGSAWRLFDTEAVGTYAVGQEVPLGDQHHHFHR